MLDKVYCYLPVFFQHLFCSIKGLQIKNRRYGKGFYKELEKYENHYYDVKKELKNFLYWCNDVPFYRDSITDRFIDGLTENNVIEKIQQLPIINKNQVKENISTISQTRYNKGTINMHTSGTTGSGLVFPYSFEMENKQWAVWWRFRRSLGIQLNTWCGWLGGRSIIPINNLKPPYWRINFPEKQVMYSSYHLNATTVNFYHKDIMSRGLTWLHGYPSSVSLLASLIVERGLSPIDSIMWVTTGAENLLDFHVRMINQAFPNALVRTHYGLSEGVANISQNRKGKWVVDDDFAFVEFVPVDKTDWTICRIVGTGFSNKAFPLVRYDTGDLAKINWKDGTPEVLEIYGRQEDYIELPNGVKLGRLDHIFKDSINVKEAQIHQIDKASIELRIVKESGYSSKDENQIMDKAKAYLGSDVSIIISYCDVIEKTAAGKVRFVVNDLE